MLGWSADAVPNLAVVETVDSVKVSVTAAFLPYNFVSLCSILCTFSNADLLFLPNDILPGLKCRLHVCSWQTNSTQL